VCAREVIGGTGGDDRQGQLEASRQLRGTADGAVPARDDDPLEAAAGGIRTLVEQEPLDFCPAGAQALSELSRLQATARALVGDERKPHGSAG